MQSHDVNTILDDLAEMQFADIDSFNAGHVGAFWSGPGDAGPTTGPWEMHPDTDEFLMCTEGSVEIHILEVEVGAEPLVSDIRKVTLGAGQLVVVPRGHWHRHHVTTAFREVYVTPGSSLMSSDPDPRVTTD